MQNYVDLLLKEMKETVLFHQDVFGIKDDLAVSSYLNIRDDIFCVFEIFSSLDKDFAKSEMKLLLEDSLSIIEYFGNFTLTSEITQNLYEKKPASVKCSEEEFTKAYSKTFKELKMTVISLVNTKLYYLDLYIWNEANKSSAINFYLREKSEETINNTKTFFKTKVKKSLNTTYSAINKNTRVKYEESFTSYLTSLVDIEETKENPLLLKLIMAKNSIAFFKNMPDNDIKKIVKNITFIKYKMHETIITQNDDSREIYYLLSGKTRVIVGTNTVSTLEKGSIFGEFSSITAERRSATIKAHDNNVTVIRFDFTFDKVDEIPKSFTILYHNIINSLIRKITSSNKHKTQSEKSMLTDINASINKAKGLLEKTNAEIKRNKKTLSES